MASSRMGCVLSYASCPILWASKMQKEIALSSTEAEYVALSQAMRGLIPVMDFIREAQKVNLPIIPKIPRVHCSIFEDNSGAIENAKVPKMRPSTKYMNIKYHHFRDHVKKGLISVHQVSTTEQITDIFTQPLQEAIFENIAEALLDGGTKLVPFQNKGVWELHTYVHVLFLALQTFILSRGQILKLLLLNLEI